MVPVLREEKNQLLSYQYECSSQLHDNVGTNEILQMRDESIQPYRNIINKTLS